MKTGKPVAALPKSRGKTGNGRDSSEGGNARSRPEPTDSIGSSSLKRASDSLVEGCLIVAVVAIPLYFSVLTNTGYEPDKAALLRILATIAAAAWAVSFLSGKRSRPNWPADPLLLCGLLVLVAYCLATALSIDSRLSFFGSHSRQIGLTTRAAFTVFFICAATHLRRREQIERIVTALIFGSIAAVTYGFAEQFGFNPLSSPAGDPSTLASSVRSTFGQHVLFASYLVMVIPFTAARALKSWRDPVRTAPAGAGFEGTLCVWIVGFTLLTFFVLIGTSLHLPSLFGLFPAILAGYAALAVIFDSLPLSQTLRRVQIWGYTGLLILQVLTLAFTAARGAWIAALVGLAVFSGLVGWRLYSPRVWMSALGAAALVTLFVVVLNIPGGPLQPIRGVHGMSRLANLTDSGGTQGSGQGRLLLWQGIGTLMTKTPSIGGTWAGAARDVVGYGPEATQPAFEAVFPLQLRRVTSEIWVWDRAHNIYLDDLIESGLLGLGAWAAVVVLFFGRAYRSLRGSDETTAWLIIAMVSAMVAHLVDGFFGLETMATVLLFWLVLGAMTRFPEPTEDSEQVQGARALSLSPVAWYWGVLLVVGAGLALFARGSDLPAALATLWIVSAVCGAALVAFVIFSRDNPANQHKSTKAKRVTAEKRGRPQRVLYAGVGVLAAFLLISQLQFERAAIADRAGTTEFAVADVQAAIGHLQQAARANGFDPQYRAELGALYRSLAESTRTSGPNQRLPGDPWSIDPQLAITLGRNQLFGLSIASFDSARSLAPLLPDSYNNLGITYLKWKHAREALSQFRQAQLLSPNNPRYQDQEALAQLQGGQFRQAASHARVAVALDPNYWYSYYALAMSYHHFKEHSHTRQEAASALLLLPHYWPPPEPSYTQQLQNLRRSG